MSNKRDIKKYLSLRITPLVFILVSILVTFVVSRLITYLTIVSHVLPSYVFLNIKGFRIHHFVYGNIIITITSFLAIGLGVNKHKNLFAICYGVGLGLVLDEFLMWIGDVPQLTANVMWIPHSTTVIALVAVFIASIIMIRLYKLHKLWKR
jgi:hypothetical protein